MRHYYQDEHVTIYHGDCRDVMPGLQPKSIDLVLADPPYEKEAHSLQRRVQREHKPEGYGGIITVEELPFDTLTADLRTCSAREIARVSRRWSLTFCQIEGAPLWREVYEQVGLVYKRTCIWVKPDGMPQYSGDRPGMGYEAFIATHQPGRSAWNGGGRHGVFTFAKGDGQSHTRPHLHPTQKPLKLVRELVALFSNPGDLILDPFMGSGTTLRAAKDLGRRAIGIELDERYVNIAIDRLRQEVFAL